MPSLETLPMKGIYTLIILVNTKSRLRIGKLGYFNFKKGYYAYTGSALGNGATSLKRRVARHFKREKPKNWHIDFLLANKNARITAVIAAESSINKECQINNLIKNIQGATVPIVGFGASDCKQKCKSHLIYFGEENVKEKIVKAYTHLFEHGEPIFEIKQTKSRQPSTRLNLSQQTYLKPIRIQTDGLGYDLVLSKHISYGQHQRRF